MASITNFDNAIDVLLDNINTFGGQNIGIPGFTVPGRTINALHLGGLYRLTSVYIDDIDINRRALWEEIKTGPNVYATASKDEFRATLLRLLNADAPIGTGGKRRTKIRKSKNRRTKNRRNRKYKSKRYSISYI